MSSASPITYLFRELQRRRVLRTAGIYIVGAWLALQIADVVFPALDIPDQAIRFLLYAAVLGFPVALIFGWLFDIEAGGIRRTAPAGSDELATPQPLRRSDFVILLALLGVVSVIGYSTFSHVIETPENGEPITVSAIPESNTGLPIVAVLPFVFSSLQNDSDFFANGVHSDLLSQLAQLNAIRVISRTSMLEYQNTAKPITQIGTELGADVVVEGSIQLAGEQMRINVQFIRAQSDEQLGARSFNRQLTAENIFQVQSEISRAIAAAVEATISPEDDGQLSVIPTKNMQAYRAYHDALEASSSAGTAQGLLKKSLSLDPDFIRAMTELVGQLGKDHFFYDQPENIPQAEALIERIAKLAPNSADHLTAQSLYTYFILRDNATALELVTRALDKAPSDTRLLSVKGWILRRSGDFAGKIENIRQILLLEPTNKKMKLSLVSDLMTAHEYEAAEILLASVTESTWEGDRMRIALALRQHGDIKRYVADLEALFAAYREGKPTQNDLMLGLELWEAYIAARRFDAADELLATFDFTPIENPNPPPGALSQEMYYTISSAWLSQDADRITRATEKGWATVEVPSPSQDDNVYSRLSFDLDRTILNAAVGNAERTEQLIQKVLRDAAHDNTLLMSLRPDVCQGLGMSGAKAATVDCLRAAMTRPSGALSYLEPLMPYYDSVRQSPEFAELMDEVSQ
ncbi:MAG: hypothetical protein AB8B96_12620 [Lysobacterales bacterium]